MTLFFLKVGKEEKEKGEDKPGNLRTKLLQERTVTEERIPPRKRDDTEVR